MTRILLSLVFILAVQAGFAQCPDYNQKEVTAYRRLSAVRNGKVVVEGDFKGTYFIHMYHSDAPGEIFATWPCRENTTITLAQDHVPVTLASDWGVQIEFENEVTSCVYFLGDIGKYEDGTFYVKSTSIYSGR